MAKYDFKCDDCKVIWEKEYSVHKVPKRNRCPKCNKLSEKVISMPGVHFKGKGWYNNKTKQRKELRNRDQAKRFYNQAITDSDKRIGEKKYTIMAPDYKWMEKRGIMRETKGQEKINRAKSAERTMRQLLQTAGNKYDTVKIKK